MNKENEEYFLALFDMFNTEGWKNLMVELEKDRDVLSQVELVSDANDLYFRKGKLAIINSLLNYKEYLEGAYRDANEASDA